MDRTLRLSPILLLAAAGCGNLGQAGLGSFTPWPVGDVDAIVVRLTPPTAMNWDNHPAPDGFQAQVHLFQLKHDLPVTVKGTLEFLLYEGRIAANDAAGRQPLRTWQFTPERLRDCLGRSIVGWGYAMRLGWGRQVPAASSVTLLARYQPPDGQATYSAPLSVPIGG